MKLERKLENVSVNGRSFVVALDEHSRAWLCIGVLKDEEEMLLPLFGPVSRDYSNHALGRNRTNDPYIAAAQSALMKIRK